MRETDFYAIVLISAFLKVFVFFKVTFSNIVLSPVSAFVLENMTKNIFNEICIAFYVQYHLSIQ